MSDNPEWNTSWRGEGKNISLEWISYKRFFAKEGGENGRTEPDVQIGNMQGFMSDTRIAEKKLLDWGGGGKN